MQPTPRSLRQRRLDIGLFALTVFTVAAVIAALVWDSRPAQSAAESNYTPPAGTESELDVPFAPLDEAVKQLEDASEPWTLAVLGDSTGNEPGEWVHRVTEALAQETGRPAVVHNWSIDTDSYDDTTEISGDGEPIIVWNGSASGKDASYSLEHRQDLAPEDADLVIINHGHNQTTPDQTATGIRSLASWAKSAWDAPPALGITLQNDRTDEQADKHEEIVSHLRDRWVSAENVVLIDVFKAYQDSNDIPALVNEDGFHPSEAGQEVWAETVLAALGL